ncbi:hypothetical protein GCM10027176_29880 [Actinoallomurus bryophytorum]|uniref:DUF4440 domain-containing protein n=1 Tax=Actinoallomurus bryophytorum TaxID=1490222 RepID=A0A543CGD4_9ACTN|nr:DUF4440 domain-containing protein [Actinoallomurus bryophytorum]TQL96151.1 hypothetical protein FB559_1673 [Actinoallomurus bryophytorum]
MDDGTTDTDANLERLVTDFFAAVSFEPGAMPDYTKLYGLFIDGGKLIKNSTEVPEISNVDEFIEPRQKMIDSGELTSFAEFEIGHITEIFGNVAHRMSTYGKRGTMNGAAFAAEGVISTQFILTPHGWKMTSMAWDDERPGLIIPDRYR